MKRRDFIALLGGAAASWPLAARAQQPAMPVVGFLTSAGRNDRPYLVDALRRGLSEVGFVEGRGVTIEYRFAENQIDRLPALAADLVGRKVAVIAAVAGASSVSAAKAATTTIPIVFTFAADPVKAGLVASLNRPGGNITGISSFNTELGSKGLELLHELVPNIVDIAWLANPEDPFSAPPSDLQDAARKLSRQLIVLNASTPEEIDTMFARLRQQHVGALVVASNPFFTTRGQQIAALAAHDGIPTLYFNREFVAAGGLMSYGNDVTDQYRRAGLYVGRILKGEKPADLPVDLSTKFEFVINLKTAKTLGLNVPATLLATADEVIE